MALIRGRAASPSQASGLALAAGLVVLLSASRVWLIPARVSANANEGWNAFQAVRALGAGPLYPDPAGLIGDNYPPLSFFIVGWAGRLLGDPIVAGRVLSLVAVIAVAAAIFAGVRRLGGSVVAAGAAALVFLTYDATLFRAYLAMDDPQWLAHALMTAGLVALIPARPGLAPKADAVVTAALLMVAGGFVKHNLVAFPLAATLWLGLRHPRALLVWLPVAGLSAAAGLATCIAAFGSDFLPDLLAGDRHLSALRMAWKAGPVIAATLPLMVVAALTAGKRSSDARLELPLLATALGVILGLVQRAGQGVNVNAHFEGLIALCILAGVALSQAEAGGRLKPWRPQLWLIAPFVILAPLALAAEAKEMKDRPRAEQAWADMQRRIAQMPGRVACETQALCFWAGKGFELDVFLYGQHVARRHEARALEAALDAGRFSAVQLDAPRPGRERRGEVENPLPALISARSRLVFTDAEGRRLVVPVR